MFAGLETVQANPRRGWTALASFTLQAAAVAAALAIPMMYPHSLPDAFAHRRIFVPISNPSVTETTTPPHSETGHTSPTLRVQSIAVTPDTGFHYIRPGSNTEAPVAPPDYPTGVGTGSSLASLNLGAVLPPAIRPTVAPPVLISHPMQSYLIRRVEPVYPMIAKTAGVQGEVIINAVISTEGRIERAQVTKGSPLLTQAALDAIRQWRYRPYLLNDKPVEVETEIRVTFVLSR